MFDYSTGSYKSNVADIEWVKTSSAAGSLDASAALTVVSDNFKLYNINVKNTYGSGQAIGRLEASGQGMSRVLRWKAVTGLHIRGI